MIRRVPPWLAIVQLAGVVTFGMAKDPPVPAPFTPPNTPIPVEPPPASKVRAIASPKESARPKSLVEARDQGQLRQLPIVAVVLADDEQANDKLRAELADRATKKELAGYVVVEILASRLPEETILWQVERSPGLCVLTSTGRWIATFDGKLTADDIASWLRKNRDAAAPTTADLTKSSTPDAAEVTRLVSAFGSRDPLEREAALRRLTPHPKESARAVVQAFLEGSLQARLTALEALQTWRAPIEDLEDPWNAAARTPPRLLALRKWSADPQIVESREPTAAELARIREDFDRLLQDDETTAVAARERLAQFASALRPEVLTRLKEATTDLARQRLTSLRYRLAATPVLALRWPDGFDRLASPKQTVRHQAARDLEQLVSVSDEKLLLELFASPDPFVREISLRILHRASADIVSDSLLKLLYDSDANVRSAVLKQMLDAPPAEWVGKLVEYMAWEKETDLMVAAVRVLREIGTDPAGEALIAQFEHSAWQVRAEAVEGVMKIRPRYQPLSGTLQVKVNEKIGKLLDDPDSYVAGKALGLVADGANKNLKQLVALAERHPEVRVAVVGVLAQGVLPANDDGRRSENVKLDLPVLEALRKYAADPGEEVRAATIAGLMTIATSAGEKNGATVDGLAKEIEAALADATSSVRVAAWHGIYRYCTGLRGRRNSPGDAWLASFRKGTGWPKWLAAVKPRLSEALKSTDSAERAAAASMAVALGDETAGFAVVGREAGESARTMHEFTDLFHWTPTAPRKLVLFDLLLAQAKDEEKLATLVHGVGSSQASAAIPRLWKLVDAGRTEGQLLNSYRSALRQLYRDSDDPGDALGAMFQFISGAKPGSGPAARIKRDVLPRIATGSDDARALGLTLLASVDEPLALEKTKELLAAPKISPLLRRDAFKIQLNLLPPKDATKKVIALLDDADEKLRRRALEWIASEHAIRHNLQELHDDVLYLELERDHRSSRSNPPLLPEPPAGVSAELLLPFLADADPDARAIASILLIALDRAEGWDTLHRLWLEKGPASPYTDLLVTAIALRNDSEQIPLLVTIYESMRKEQVGNYRMQPFYWKIRTMTGPEALKLRQRIRSEVGVSNL